MKLIRCMALRAFTQFVPGFGQVHGDPDNQDEAVQFPMVPESHVDLLVDEGKIEAPEDEPVAPEPVPAPRAKRGKSKPAAEPEGDAPADEGETATEDAAPV
ncbi:MULTISPECIES: hypothetical protein [unclassified Blastomonas]|uniref:hypothetical protein n=1 Tax=unclassified Blastomonas TaxID=2626550 RepID=UPI000826791C|nr:MULTISPECIES: hypothetical protein [unclassified Blastomonas]